MKKMIFFAVLCCSAALAAADESKALMESAKKAEADKNQTLAVELYCKASSAAGNPGDRFAALQKAARILVREKKFTEAQKLLLPFAEDASIPKGNRTQAYLECARCVQTPEEKIPFLDAGIALGTGDHLEAACRNEKASVFLSRKKYQEASAEYRNVADNESFHINSRAVALNGLANAAIQLKDYDAAHKYYQSIRAFQEKDPRFSLRDVEIAERKLFFLEKKYDEGIEAALKSAKDPKVSARERERAFEEALDASFNMKNDVLGTRKILEDCKDLEITHSKKVNRIIREIKLLLDED